MQIGNSDSWNVEVKMSIRPSSSTGVLFALVHRDRVPLSVAVVTLGEEDAVSAFRLLNTFVFAACQNAALYRVFPSLLQKLQVFLDGVPVAKLDTLMLCYPDRLTVQLNVTPTDIQITANSSTVTYIESDALQKALERLNATMQSDVQTYIGGIPGQFQYQVNPLLRNSKKLKQ